MTTRVIFPGRRRRRRRLRAGCSRLELAHSVGVPVETISEWEGEETPIRCPVAVEVVLRDAEARSAEPSRRAS